MATLERLVEVSSFFKLHFTPPLCVCLSLSLSVSLSLCPSMYLSRVA
jgi:hypothetical protein